MKVILFGATGMLGQAVLQECLDDPQVDLVAVVTRTALAIKHAKIREYVHADFYDFAPLADKLTGFDACFFCLGRSAVGMTEADYRHVTYDLTLAAATLLARRNPQLTFIYVSGAGTDAQSRTMWARVKGETETALAKLPFKAAYFFRPGYIQPVRGVVSKTGWYRAIYAVVGPLYPALKAIAPNHVITSAQIGRAMLHVAREGASQRTLENKDINALAAG